MVQWTADKDQIILKGIFKFHDIKSSAPLLKYLAEQIGGDCTPKAVSHRLNNIRNHGKPLANGDSATSTPTKAATTPKTPASRAKSTGAKKKKNKPTDSDSDSNGPEGLQEEVQSPSVNRKRARETPKKSYAEPDSSEESEEPAPVPIPKRQRVKSEPKEDLDYGCDLGDVGIDEV